MDFFPFFRFLKALVSLAWVLRLVTPGLGASYSVLLLFSLVSSGALLLTCEKHHEGAHISCRQHIFLSLSVVLLVNDSEYSQSARQ